MRNRTSPSIARVPFIHAKSAQIAQLPASGRIAKQVDLVARNNARQAALGEQRLELSLGLHGLTRGVGHQYRHIACAQHLARAGNAALAQIAFVIDAGGINNIDWP